MAFNKKYQGVPGQSELWKVGTKTYLTYKVPKSTLVIGFQIHDKSQIQDLFGPGATIRYDREIDEAQAKKAGLLHVGTREQLRIEDEHPWRTFEEAFRTEVQTNPAYKDPKFLALVAAAALQGRSPTVSELQTTDWYRKANDAQRSWQVLKLSDPASANEFRQENRDKVANLFAEYGSWDTPADLVNRVADYFTNGAFNETEVRRQIRGIVDPQSGIAVHGSLTNFIAENELSVNTTQQHEQDVLELVRTWLGPSHGWTDAQVKSWAGRFRSNPGARDSLISELGKQRLALYPEHENPDLSYEDIAAPWRGFFMSEWGQVPDETDGLFSQIVRLNDAGTARQVLIREGLKRGVPQVAQAAITKLGSALSGPISADAIKA